MIDGFVDDPANRAAKLAAAYIKIVETYVFEPVGAHTVDAKPPVTGPQANGYAFSYKFPGTTGATTGATTAWVLVPPAGILPSTTSTRSYTA
jgi:hypothetical protein